MKTRRKVKRSLLSLLLLLAPGVVCALPIGTFNWNEHSTEDCDLFSLCGAYFSVENFSDDPINSLGAPGENFADVFVDLATDLGLQSLALGDIAPGSSSQSIDDLSGTIISSASLRLSFGLAGVLSVAGLSAPGSELIDFVADDADDGSVEAPEPPVAALMVLGLLGIAASRKSRQLHL